MNTNKPTLFLDIDDVLTTSKQYFGKYHPKYNGHPFDPKCVKVLNEIIEKINPIIIISSDWKYHFTIEQLNEVFKLNGVNALITDITPSLWGGKEAKFTSLSQLDECRAEEILKYVKEHELIKWVAIDDLNLKPWIQDNFVRCTHSTEGIKQSGVKTKILKILNDN
jgi:hypothetical protein